MPKQRLYILVTDDTQSPLGLSAALCGDVGTLHLHPWHKGQTPSQTPVCDLRGIDAADYATTAKAYKAAGQGLFWQATLALVDTDDAAQHARKHFTYAVRLGGKGKNIPADFRKRILSAQKG